MDNELGKRIAQYRKARGLTQEAMAQALGVSPQAVSKWEVGASCPDILLLPKLASQLGLTVDQLLTGEKVMPVQVMPPERRKKLRDMVLRIVVDDNGEQVKVNIPMPLVQLASKAGKSLPRVSGTHDVDLDLAAILELVEQGMIGNLMDVDCGDGTTVRIYVE